MGNLDDSGSHDYEPIGFSTIREVFESFRVGLLGERSSRGDSTPRNKPRTCTLKVLGIPLVSVTCCEDDERPAA